MTIAESIDSWPEKDKERAMRLIRARTSTERKVWYCPIFGRQCDGNPHEGVPYRHARGSQWPPATMAWMTWLIMSGRGWGKTRTGAEWVRAVAMSGKVGRIAMVGRRGPDVRGTMVEGESGLIFVCENAGIGYDWQPSKKEFTFENGAVAYGFSAEEPDQLRGPQFGAGWLDEPAHMDLIEDVWDNLTFGMRIPGLPGGAKILCTTTPLPNDWIKATAAEPTTIVTTGSSLENEANLDDTYKARIARYAGTRKGLQEIEGAILEEIDGALWVMDLFDKVWIEHDEMERIVVAIDPAGEKNKRADLTGIVVVGKKGNTYFVFEDATGSYTPEEWAGKALDLLEKYNADCIVAEKNFGGDMVRAVIEQTANNRGQMVRVKVARAQASKKLRAEPIVGLYEQKRVKHVGALVKLENEMCTWVPGKSASPNRIDATVWAITELNGGTAEAKIARPTGRIQSRLAQATNGIQRRRRAA